MIIERLAYKIGYAITKTKVAVRDRANDVNDWFVRVTAPDDIVVRKVEPSEVMLASELTCPKCGLMPAEIQRQGCPRRQPRETRELLVS